MQRMVFGAAVLVGLGLAAPSFAQGMTPEQYLRQAKQAVQQHRTMTALSNVNNAENEVLRAGVADENRGARESEEAPPIVRQLGAAREAIQQHHWDQANRLIDEAMAHPAASVGAGGSQQ